MARKKIIVPRTAEDYRELAKKQLPKFLFDYIDGGANKEQTMAENINAFARYNLLQRVMKDVSHVDTSSSFLGNKASMPVALGPVGMAGMMARRGEVLGAKASLQANIPFTGSTVGLCSYEEIVKDANPKAWFQLYMLKDREIVKDILMRALALGCEHLIFTVDMAIPGMRQRDFQNGIESKRLKAKLEMFKQLIVRPNWLWNVAINGRPLTMANLNSVLGNHLNLNKLKEFVLEQFDPSVTWSDIEWLRSLWPGKLIIKGVMELEDAKLAQSAGADALLLSNHGGRQLDGVSASLYKLHEMSRVLGDDSEIYIDGGIRNGIDVVKALALGANGVFLGRPWVWAMAAEGQQGVLDFLTILKEEISIAMSLIGVNAISEINEQVIEKNILALK